MIQYASKFIKFQAAASPDIAMAFGGLGDNMSVARKLFRLFKFFNEYVKMTVISAGKLPPAEKNLQILCRLAFAFYWLFDNLAVLIKVKFLTSFDLKAMARRASKCWLVGIWLGILVACIELSKASNRQSQLLLSKANQSKSGGDKDSNEQF